MLGQITREGAADVFGMTWCIMHHSSECAAILKRSVEQRIALSLSGIWFSDKYRMALRE